MASEESLRSGKYMSDDDCWAEGIYDVLVIWMKEQSVVSISRESNDCADLKIFLHQFLNAILKLVIFFILPVNQILFLMKLYCSK
jgi:hypothetical protein